jgi:plasmid maintenance system antidote protein VapI
MITKKKIKIQYYLSEKEREKAYYALNKLNLSVTAYAKSLGANPATIQQVLNGELPLTRKTYARAFKQLDCIDNLPEEYKKV